MSEFKILMPKLGESVQEATITKIFVEIGSTIEEDDNLLEVATDKVDSEIPSPVDGVVSEILYKEGDIVAVNEPVLIINLDSEAPVPSKSSSENQKKEEEVPIQQEQPKNVKIEKIELFLSPLVKSIMKEEKIEISELKSIQGSGSNGRITKKDILDYIGNNDTTESIDTNKEYTLVVESGARVEPMSRSRKIIAKRMVESVQTSPHVSTVVDIDVTNLVAWRNRVKDTFFSEYKSKLTYLHLFMMFAGKALKAYPYINASVDAENIILKENINIGIAVATKDNNLLVPVVHDVIEKSLVGIVKSTNSVVDLARANKLTPDLMEGGTFTITNFGSIGALFGTPIINQPQVAIMAPGSIERIPCVVDSDQGEMIAIRSKMYLTLSYDHRVIDGMLAGKFLNHIKKQMEDFSVDTQI